MLKNMGQMLAAMAAAKIARPIIIGHRAPPPVRLGGNRKHHKKSRSKARWHNAVWTRIK
jgi:hypothetical protein